MKNRFENQIALVTGGSSGIGFAIAKNLLENGANKVFITGRTKTTLDKAVEKLGKKAIAIQSDVSKLEDIELLKNEILKSEKSLDILFANAGIAQTNEFGNTNSLSFDKMFDINVKGVFFTVQTMLRLLKDESAVILTSSMVGNKGMENLSLYNASKAAVRSFARSWANDLKNRKIRVNAISPGFTRTPIQENSLKMNEEQIKAFEEYASSVVPLGYVAKPEEIASAAVFLASKDAKYINAIELSIDGGFTQI